MWDETSPAKGMLKLSATNHESFESEGGLKIAKGNSGKTLRDEVFS